MDRNGDLDHSYVKIYQRQRKKSGKHTEPNSGELKMGCLHQNFHGRDICFNFCALHGFQKIVDDVSFFLSEPRSHKSCSNPPSTSIFVYIHASTVMHWFGFTVGFTYLLIPHWFHGNGTITRSVNHQSLIC